MKGVKILLEGYECNRCKHTWIPLNKKKEPSICPKCKSPYWNSDHSGVMGRPRKS